MFKEYMEKTLEREKVLFIGGRRGLGSEVLKQWQGRFPQHQLAASSRQNFSATGVETFICDLAGTTDIEKLQGFIQAWKPQRVFIFSGGGPYGTFTSKAWKDHQWALQVSFLGPAQVIHGALQISELSQIVAVGSAIAEDKADPNAASYSAAKHALKGLISTLHSEFPARDIRLFSPGYMATDMLPVPQRANKAVAAPEKVAEAFIEWALNKEASWHGFYQPD